MSRQKNLMIAGIALVILIGGYFGATAYKRHQIDKQAEQYKSVYMTEIDTKKVTRIELPLKGVILERKGEVWTSPAEALGVQLDQEEIKSILWSLCNMRYERVADENPKDLGPFGLSNPKARVILTLEDGSKVELLGGEKTPTGMGYYGMKAGEPKVYILPSYPGERLYVSLTDFRDRKLPSFNPDEVERLNLVYGNTRISIEPKPRTGVQETSFTTHIITSPYKLPRGVDSQAFNKLVSALGKLRIKDFVSDKPTSLTPYGLDKPEYEIYVKAKVKEKVKEKEGEKEVEKEIQKDVVFHLFLGKEAAKTGPEWEKNRVFAKLKDSPTVFLIEDIRSDITVKPFDLIDKFAFIINIDKVDKLSIDYLGSRHIGEIKREKVTVTEKDKDGKETKKEETKETFLFDGKEVKAEKFKDLYQNCIGLLIEAEIPPGGKATGKAEVTLEYQLNDPAGKIQRVQYLPFNRDFYALSREGVVEFLVSKRQVEKIAESLKKVTEP
ncbi:MAG: DUF4340 domain-containing protein [Spirochaetes bacterium]|nr:DUF4340 domain-containing protein [Spirochaetota bacterium]